MYYYDDADVCVRHLVSALQYMLRHSVLAIKGVKDGGDGDTVLQILDISSPVLGVFRVRFAYDINCAR